jgi:hypothetical protein
MNWPSPTTVIAALAFILGAATFYRNFFYTRHGLMLIPVGGAKERASEAEPASRFFQCAVVNTGNRDALLLGAEVLCWASVTPTNDWTHILPSHPDQAAGVLIKPQEIRLVDVALPNALPDREKAWFVWFEGNQTNWVILGLCVTSMNAKGDIYTCTFELGYAWPNEGKPSALSYTFAPMSHGTPRTILKNYTTPLSDKLKQLARKPFGPPSSPRSS